ncbi:MAG: hypothetical protein M9916_12340 [Crocinitomicaceae bacterium]|nr:hypothetical protein [Crocinitomicaceae bacterium]
MKIYSFSLLFLTLFFSTFVDGSQLFAQNSYEFGITLPVESEATSTVNAVYYGTYESEKGPEYNYEINENGLFLKTINIQAITQETIRETGKYSVRNGYIFGITEDSIPCLFEDDKYYFGVRNTIQLTGNSSVNVLTQLSVNSYILNYKSDNGYVPALFEFIGNQLKITDFDYDIEGKIFKKIKEQQLVESATNGLKTYILRPTVKEWSKISKKDIFVTSHIFEKK